MANSKHYDLVIVGTGSGNSIPGPEFDNKSIAIVEKGTFGGTCLNVGCIPTKMFVHAADLAHDIADAKRFGVQASLNGVDWPSIVSRVFDNRIDPIARGGEEYRRGPRTPNIDVYDQHATFIAPKTLKTGIGEEKWIVTGDQIVIATGARPAIPDFISDSNLTPGVDYFTNENVMRMPELPQSMIVLGGGFIAMEFSHIFSSLGVEVKLINRSDKVLRVMDEDISARMTEIVSDRYETHLGRLVSKVEKVDGLIVATLDDGSQVKAETLLVALGRIPNGDQMNLEAAGIELDGAVIKVDEYGRTSAQGVWALGDVSSPYQLKHVANAEMRAVRHNLLHPDNLKKLPHDAVPAAVFSNPQIATVGLTEQQAKEAGYDITVKIQNYSDIAYGWALEDSTGFAKVIADQKTGKLLGAHIIGYQASSLIQSFVTMLAFDMDVRSFATEQYWIHPALTELVENALLGLDVDNAQ
ncbi:mycothione reductase [Corynebacterium sp. SCR221107]|uniref:mycothione reductase n=1 Tax=Corynebacterium sp. SCR221107 TaxID=3017361 RepID=UPI0022EC1BD0|nr:mycothione reductase [Corynebacterium sp. SCR221107]WBT07910.1 mycothione reductase [Corynebacterium sp. SCR221107]